MSGSATAVNQVRAAAGDVYGTSATGRRDCRRPCVVRPPTQASAGARNGGVLSANWFALVAGWSLRRAFRCREYSCFLSIGISREFVGWSVSIGSDAHLEFTSAIAPTLREADLFGEIDQ